MALTIPNAFAAASGNVAASQIDSDFTTIANWINSRNPTSGLLSARPAAAFAGAVYFATDTGLLYLDTGTAWITVALGVIGAGVLPGFLGGFGLSNDGGTPNTVLDMAAGAASDSTAVALIQSTVAFTKKTGGAWAAGTAGNGMGTGLTIANSTWYHVFAIINNALTDFYFDTSVTAANKPAGTTAFRRIGSFLTSGAAAIIAFVQDADYFRWAASVLDVNSGTNPGTANITRTLASVPTGVSVFALLTVSLDGTSTGNSLTLYLSDLAANDEAPSLTAAPLGTVGLTTIQVVAAGPYQIRTNASAQIRSRLNISGANDRYYIATLGWIDRRGRG